MNAVIDMNNNKITNLAAPTNPNDAARFADVIGQDLDTSGFLQTENNLEDLTDIDEARANLDVDNVDNTRDADKPVSAATAAQLALKLPKSGGVMTGPITLAADGTDALNPVTRQQLDAAIIGAGEGAVTEVNGYTGAVILSATDIGLGNVQDKSSATIRSEITASNVNTALGYTAANNTDVLARVISPGTNSADFVPQWNGANSKTLKNGRAIGATNSTDLVDRATGDVRYAPKVTGFFDVTAVNGVIDLTGHNNRVVRLFDGAGDPNVWEILGVLPGERLTIKVNEKFAFLTEPPGFYAGSCVIVGNYQAHATGHTTLSVGPEDTVALLCTDTNEFEVWIEHNQFISRVDWAGSSREPLATYHAVGQVGEFDSANNIVFGDNLHPVNGTSRKGFTGGMFVNCVNDTGGFFWGLYTNGGFGLEDPAKAEARTDLQTMSTHYATLASKFDDGGTLNYATASPSGYAGPGSLFQGWSAQAHMHHTELPSNSGTGGGHTIRVTPNGLNGVIIREMTNGDGAHWLPGKGAYEAFSTNWATISAGGRLNSGNITQWNIPSLAFDILDDGVANSMILLTPANSADCDFWSATAYRYWNNLTSGMDIYWRSDEYGSTNSIIWMGATDSGTRSRAIGFAPGDGGFFTSGKNDEGDFTQNQDIQYQLVDDATKTLSFRNEKFGFVTIVDQDGHAATFAISGATNSARILSCTDTPDAPSTSTRWATTAGSTDGKTNVWITSTNTVNVRNRLGVTQSYKQFTKI